MRMLAEVEGLSYRERLGGLGLVVQEDEGWSHRGVYDHKGKRQGKCTESFSQGIIHI